MTARAAEYEFETETLPEGEEEYEWEGEQEAEEFLSNLMRLAQAATASPACGVWRWQRARRRAAGSVARRVCWARWPAHWPNAKVKGNGKPRAKASGKPKAKVSGKPRAKAK